MVAVHIGIHADGDGGFFGYVFAKGSCHVEAVCLTQLKTGLPEHDLHHGVSGGFGADECVVFEDVYEAVCGAVNGDFYTVAVKDDASNGDIEKIKEKCNLFINDYYDLL